MSNVSVTIAGRRYTLACAEGEESHIAKLAQSIDSKLSSIPGLSTQSETQTLLFACLLLADALDEAHGHISALEASAQIGSAHESEAAVPLENLAEKLEGLAQRLEA